MILRRSHTWMHLLPAESGYTCRNTPAWFAKPLPSDKRSQQAIVAWGDIEISRNDLEACSALVAINAGRGIEALTHRHRLIHCQSYAVLPNLREARWFLPLDSAGATSAAFCLYTPLRLWARLQLHAARTAIHLRLPIWYHDRITIAQRQPGPLETHLQQLFPGRSLALALSSGGLDPGGWRKPAVAILEQCGQLLAFAKIAGSPVAQSLLEHEAKVLPVLQSMPGCNNLAPKLLFAGSVDGVWTIVESPIEGRRAAQRITPEHERFLLSLQSADSKPATQTGMFRRLGASLLALGAVDLQEALQSAAPILASTLVPKTVTHTDFAPWNLRRTKAGLVACNWNTAELDGLPLYDRWHHDLMVGYCIENWSQERALTYLATATQQRFMNLTPRQIQALQIVFLIHTIARMLEQGHAPDDEMVQWYWSSLHVIRRQLTCSGTRRLQESTLLGHLH